MGDDDDIINLGSDTDLLRIDLKNRLGATTVTWANSSWENSFSIDDTTSTDPWNINSSNGWKVEKKAPPKITFKEDPIAVVLALKAQNVCGSTIFEYMDPGTEDDIFPPKKLIFEYDLAPYIAEAQEIREYYKMKLVTSALLGVAKTEFRKSLGEILTNEDGVYTREHIPIFIRLPDFYEEDTYVEKLIEPLETVRSRKFDRDFETDLTYIGKIKQCRRSSTRYRYTFKDAKNQLYVVTVAVENNLQGVMEYLCTSKGNLRIKGQRNFALLHGHNFNCYEVNRFTIEG